MSLLDHLVMSGFTWAEAREISGRMHPRRRLEVERKLADQVFEVTIGSAVFQGVTVMRWHRPVDKLSVPSTDSAGFDSTRCVHWSRSTSTPSP